MGKTDDDVKVQRRILEAFSRLPFQVSMVLLS